MENQYKINLGKTMNINEKKEIHYPVAQQHIKVRNTILQGRSGLLKSAAPYSTAVAAY